jgi:DNA-binding transcriptional MerR regulator
MANRKYVPTDDTIQRERQVLELRRAGVTFDAIAEQLKYADRGAAYKAFKRALTRTLQEPAAELRDLEVDRLDQLQIAMWEQAMRGDVQAVDRVLRIMAQRAQLLGLNHADGVAERQVRLQEQQGVLLATVISRVLDRLELNAEQRALVGVVVPEELLAVSADGS